MGAAPRSLADWLQCIESRHPAEIALGLERVRAVALRMGLTRPGARAITVGGTNGKGSCVAVTEALLLAAGERVGAYTSPHLRRYNERVRVQGREASEEALCAAFAAVEAARADVPLTYFEFGTLAALEIFREARVDWLVLEVGLGGRLDAVNLIDADVAVVTSVQIDHTEWLGSDRESIGREKAGIFRSARPAVCGDRVPPGSLRTAARTLGAPWFAVGEAFDCQRTADGAWYWRGTDAQGRVVDPGPLVLPQLLEDNVACALQALVLAGQRLDSSLLRRELPRIALPGRYQRRRLAASDCVLDVAHNAAGVQCLAARLAAEPVRGRTLVLFAAMADKELDAMVSALAPLADGWLLCDLPAVRAARATEVAGLLERCAPGACVECAGGVSAAMARAAALLRESDRLVVCGSFHTVGPALDWLDERGAAEGEWT